MRFLLRDRELEAADAIARKYGSTMALADALDAIPIVANTAERNTRFPAPQIGQRVHNLQTGDIERWNGTWLLDFSGASTQVIDVTQAPFNAKGDGASDDYAAIQAALDSIGPLGGVVMLPTPSVSYYCSQSLQIKSMTRLTGQMMWSGATVAVGGTILEFAADQTGIYVDGKDTDKNGAASPLRATSAAKSIIENLTLLSRGGTTGLLSGGTGAAVVDGVRVRTTQVQLRNLYCYNWHRNGVRIYATTGSGDPTIVGNANLWMAHNVVIGNCGADGFAVQGTDVNVGYACEVESSGNLGRGIYDSSFLGNVWAACHTSGNTGRCYETDNLNCRSLFLGCYVEGATALPAGQQARILKPSMVIGGQLATGPTGTFTADSDALVMDASRVMNGSLQFQNNSGATQVAFLVGTQLSSLTQAAFVMGSADTTIPLADIELVYAGAGVWDWRDNGSSSRAFFSFPNRTLLASLRAYAPAFRSGIYFGVLGSASAVHHKVGSAPPVAGTWVKGDRVYNDYTVSGTGTGIEHWYCQVPGTPGTWVANRAMGTLTLSAAAATVVSDARVTATSRIFITPTNAAAGTLEAGANKVYVSAKTGGASFTLTTAGGGAAAGSETYDYVIEN